MNVTPPSKPTLPEISPEASILAFPLPRLSAWIPVEFCPLEVRCRPVQVTVTSFGALEGLSPSVIAKIASSLAVPATSIVVSNAVMVALPLACIRRPVTLSVPGLFILSMVTPVAVIIMSSLFGVNGPVVLAALTALTLARPDGITTLTPD
jgi:hypothetical protein